ncbi:hypothetical protein pdam_00010126 [Pocillopora damicornis]|uniref:Uncharacterized protein n=1 Tax=Pocillopora damicornis TaxID=46731 RepID=A0A3M6V3J6_POCDA|nr:hypothetical protein pdam_00010126 [Pocillopora damicornis]
MSAFPSVAVMDDAMFKATKIENLDLILAVWRYLFLNNKARCLSTLTMVIVAHENPVKTALKKNEIYSLIRHRSHRW